MEKINYVLCKSCGSKHDTNIVQCENIEEDIEGRDVLTYKCPVTGEIVKSLVYIGHGW